MFGKVLVANRGEIALRVIRACRDLGIRSVAVFSAVDRHAPHVRLADEAYEIGPPAPRESYLNVERLLDVARRAGADAVHPGYGFLSENPAFAEACAAAGLVFVGPSPDAMRRLGTKTLARQTASAAGVPIVPGAVEPVHTVDEALTVAATVGYPVLLKAAAGGGGKGMRVVHAPDAMPAAFRAAASEATSAFGDGSLYVERLVEHPRHVEVQILADHHGNVVHLGERECSVQRRHQKLIEEAPSPAVDAALRQRLGAVAVRAARAVGYTNAGTVEFLLDSQGQFYFLEVNARLQVEHPVTELVTGLDLVREQLRIAAGQPLGFTQDDVRLRGAAIECRIMAEDPFSGFLPSTGRVVALREPSGPGVRVDSWLYPGAEIPPHYDSLLAKLITWGDDRREALARMRRALREYLIAGLRTTIPFHRFMLDHPAFVQGELDTGLLERVWPGERTSPEPDVVRVAAAVAALVRAREAPKDGTTSQDGSVAPRHSWWKYGGRPGAGRW